MHSPSVTGDALTEPPAIFRRHNLPTGTTLDIFRRVIAASMSWRIRTVACVGVYFGVSSVFGTFQSVDF